MRESLKAGKAIARVGRGEVGPGAVGRGRSRGRGEVGMAHGLLTVWVRSA